MAIVGIGYCAHRCCRGRGDDSLLLIRDSTHTFALIMDNGQEVRGTLADKQVGTQIDLFKQRVAVSGRAVFRASGQLLRIDADSVRIAAPSDELFAKVPRPNATRP